jgi:hypothetical protein
MANPFRLRWLEGWIFQTVLMEGSVQVEALGYGICLRTQLQPGESPRAAADRLVLAEDRRRRSLYNAWRRGQTQDWLAGQKEAPLPELSNPAAVPFVPPPSTEDLYRVEVPILESLEAEAPPAS